MVNGYMTPRYWGMRYWPGLYWPAYGAALVVFRKELNFKNDFTQVKEFNNKLTSELNFKTDL